MIISWMETAVKSVLERFWGDFAPHFKDRSTRMPHGSRRDILCEIQKTFSPPLLHFVRKRLIINLTEMRYDSSSEVFHMSFTDSCTLCPRACGIDRSTKLGYCGMTDTVRIGRADLHLWEEPPISGTRGSGTIWRP